MLDRFITSAVAAPANVESASPARIKPPPNGKADRAQDPGQDAFFLRLLSEHLRGRDDARFERFYPVVLGTTLGMMLANIPAVFCGHFAGHRLDPRWTRAVAAAILAAQGILVLSGVRLF